MKTFKCMLAIIVVLILLTCTNSWAGVRGKVLLVDAQHRCKPGGLILCTVGVNPESRGFALIKATYGDFANGKTVDVTAKVKSMIKPDIWIYEKKKDFIPDYPL